MATAIKGRGISIAALGIGSADPVELLKYTSSPNDVRIAADFSQLNAAVDGIAELLCPSKSC